MRGDVDDEFNSKDVDINKYFDLVDYLENAHTLKTGIQKHKYRLELILQGLQIESRKAIMHIFNKKKGKYYCRAGRNMLVIDDLGNVHPCEIFLYITCARIYWMIESIQAVGVRRLSTVQQVSVVCKICIKN